MKLRKTPILTFSKTTFHAYQKCRIHHKKFHKTIPKDHSRLTSISCQYTHLKQEDTDKYREQNCGILCTKFGIQFLK